MCRQMSESFIKGVIDKMLLDGYLRETDDMYRLLKLTETSDMLISGEEHLIMKWSERKEEFKKEKRTPKSLDADGLMLFERLRMLRIDIARNENVPPYIVFSDKALTDMCIKRPHTKAEMLNVNGVGENKYERYGKEFLKCIKEHENQDGDNNYSNEEENGNKQNGYDIEIEKEEYSKKQGKNGNNKKIKEKIIKKRTDKKTDNQSETNKEKNNNKINSKEKKLESKIKSIIVDDDEDDD